MTNILILSYIELVLFELATIDFYKK